MQKHHGASLYPVLSMAVLQQTPARKAQTQRGGQPLKIPGRQAKRTLVYLCSRCKKQWCPQWLRFCEKRMRPDSSCSGWWARNTLVKKDPNETMNLTCTNNALQDWSSKALVFYLIEWFLIPLLKNTVSSIPISFKCVIYILTWPCLS